MGQVVQTTTDEEAGSAVKVEVDEEPSIFHEDLSIVVPEELVAKSKTNDDEVSNASTGTPDLELEVDHGSGVLRASISDNKSENSDGSGTRSEPSVVTATVRSSSADVRN